MPDKPSPLSFNLTPETTGFLSKKKGPLLHQYFYLNGELQIVNHDATITAALLQLAGKSSMNDVIYRPADIGKITVANDLISFGGALAEHNLNKNTGLHHYNEDDRVDAAFLLGNALKATQTPFRAVQIRDLADKMFMVIPLP